MSNISGNLSENVAVGHKSVDELIKDYQLDRKDVYKRTLKFYRENDSKIVQLHYGEKLKLVALTQQVLHGKICPENLSPLGALDVIGKDRRNAWASLGDMSKEEAMLKFVKSVAELIPQLLPHIEAQLQGESANRETERLSREAAEREAEANAEANKERQVQEEQRRKIKDVLNRQSHDEFRNYAAQQYPDNPDQQAVLVRQLQEQHYRQYMQQVYQQQMESQASQQLQQNMANMSLGQTATNGDISPRRVNNDESGDDENVGDENDEYDDDGVGSASMWTKKEIVDFKESIRKEGGNAIVKVDHGETVTVRVPTHKDGSALFFEFATDNYDIAFGLYFEWTKPDDYEVSITKSDSEDEDLDEDYDETRSDADDPENGTRESLMDKGPPTSVIVPIFRRDCHTEVYAGTHTYPGQGVYLLKFDNTYSMWRSKTLYYRVYYTRE